MALATIKPSPTQRLGRFGGPKWIPKELPKRRKGILGSLELSEWVQRPSSHCQRSVLERFGSPKWVPNELSERRKIVKKVCVYMQIGFLASPGVLVAS